MRKLLILLAFLISTATVHAEFIMKPYEIENVMVTIYFFDTHLEMQEYFLEHFGEEEGETELDTNMRGFSAAEAVPDKNVCHLDMYVVRPLEVDDARTKTIGHELLHCVYGPGYHVDWKYMLRSVTIEVEANGSIQLSE